MDVHGKTGNNDQDDNPGNPVPYPKSAKLKKTEPDSDASNADEEREKYHKNLLKQNRFMPVIDHIEEFRWAVIRSIVWVLLFSALSMAFYDQIFKVIINPIGHLIDAGKNMGIIVKLIVTRLSDYVVVQFKLSLIAGFLFSVPVVFFEILRFIMPAFDKKYKKWSFLVLLVSVSLFWSGIFIAWKYCWAIVIEFLVLNWTPPGIDTLSGIHLPEVHLTMSDYLSFFMGFHLTFGISFQLPIICVLLAVAGILNAAQYFKHWRSIVLLIAIASAVITPPDIISMTAMMVPLFVLYLISGLFVFAFQKRK